MCDMGVLPGRVMAWRRCLGRYFGGGRSVGMHGRGHGEESRHQYGEDSNETESAAELGQ